MKDFLLTPERPVWEKLESLYVDDEPLEEEPDEDEIEELAESWTGASSGGRPGELSSLRTPRRSRPLASGPWPPPPEAAAAAAAAVAVAGSRHRETPRPPEGQGHDRGPRTIPPQPSRRGRPASSRGRGTL